MTDATAAVSPLRRCMIDDMSLRNLSPATQRSYLDAVSKRQPPCGLRPLNRTSARLGTAMSQFSRDLVSAREQASRSARDPASRRLRGAPTNCAALKCAVRGARLGHRPNELAAVNPLRKQTLALAARDHLDPTSHATARKTGRTLYDFLFHRRLPPRQNDQHRSNTVIDKTAYTSRFELTVLLRFYFLATTSASRRRSSASNWVDS